MTRRPSKFFFKIVLWVLVAGTLAVLATQFLWNVLLVALFGLPSISFLQTIGLMILGRLLTGGGWKRGGGWHGDGRGGGWQRGRWMREKWAQMTPDERQEMKTKWRERGGWHGWHGWNPTDEPADDAPIRS